MTPVPFDISLSPERKQFAEQGLGTLTPREIEILQDITNCQSAKEIARHRGISHRTVEVHKARIKAKMGARNSAEILRMIYALVFDPTYQTDFISSHRLKRINGRKY